MHPSTAVKTALITGFSALVLFAAPVRAQMQDVDHSKTPYRMDELQEVDETFGHQGVGDFDVTEDMDSVDLNIRRDAQREAALSFGARGGLAKRS